jgi:hypothetical protein
VRFTPTLKTFKNQSTTKHKHQRSTDEEAIVQKVNQREKTDVLLIIRS